MIYLIVQDWPNTHGNHAGMVHMCKLLVDKYPEKYEMLIKPSPVGFPIQKGFVGFFKRLWNYFVAQKVYAKQIYPKEYFILCQSMFDKLKDRDKVFLLEYLLPPVQQYKLAFYIKKNFPKVNIYALSHLTVKYFKAHFDRKGATVRKWAAPIDYMLTFGTSLSSYFISLGIEKKKISSGFHYVDSDYYHKSLDIKTHGRLIVIAIGNLQRNYDLLAKVVRNLPDVDWIICHGCTSVGNSFSSCKNVDIKGFLSEDELRREMDIADVSINIMKDTIGSNVITTSLAMGLAMVVSDVGSIRDYCSEENAVFCENTVDSFTAAINMLKDNPERVLQMRQRSLEASKKLTIEYVDNWFSCLGNS